MKKLIPILFLAIQACVTAQDIKPKLLRAGKLFNSETGIFMTDMAILLDGSVIKAVKPFKEVTQKETSESELIDLSKYAVLPGLIDAHTHLLYREEIVPGNWPTGMDMIRTLTMEGDAFRAIYGGVRAKAYLEAGITTVQDLGNSGQFADMALRKAIKEGIVPGPNMRCSGPGLCSSGGQVPGLLYKHQQVINDEYRIIKGVDDAVQAVRENVTQGADVIKIYSNNTPNVTALSIEEMQAIVKEAHRYGVRVTAHATNNTAIYNAVISGVDGIEHGYQVDDTTLELMAKKKVVLVPTDGDLFTTNRYFQLAFPNDTTQRARGAEGRTFLKDRLQRAIKKGVMIVAGSDDYVNFKMPFSEPSKRTLIGYLEAGMPIADVLKAATANAALHLGWPGKLGVIKQGAYADIIAVDPDLDKNIYAIMKVHFVLQDGKIAVTRLKE